MDRNIYWHSPPCELALSVDDVHVWRASLELMPTRVNQLSRILSDDELSRISRLPTQRHRYYAIASRGLLRELLAYYLQLNSAELIFDYNSYGKPTLNSRVGASGIQFNVAHSEGVVLYAISSGRRVGIDIEYIRDNFNYEKVAAANFSVDENEMLYSLPASERNEAFFNCWTYKEAYIKAIGEGLFRTVHQFTVTFETNEQPQILHTSGVSMEAKDWSLQRLYPGYNCVAALAVEGYEWQLSCWQSKEISQDSKIV